MSESYFDQHVIATAPGENGWVKKLDEFLQQRRPQIGQTIQQQLAAK